MQTGKLNPVRNQTMEVCKLIAAIFVVFLHVQFPGMAGGMIACVSRFAVPMFFAFSGYFSLGVSRQKLARRMGNILLLEAAGIGLNVLWQAFLTLRFGGSLWEYLRWLLGAPETWKAWLLLNVDPFQGPLWYLSAMAYCYGILWLYTGKKQEKSPAALYWLGALLLGLHFLLSKGGRLGICVDFRMYRNAWLFGLPMFFMGMFLRQYRRQILEKLRLKGGRLALLIPVGLGLSLLEWRVLPAGEMYLGTVLTAAAIVLWSAECPAVPCLSGGVSAFFGKLSTAVYLLHILVLDGYTVFFQWRVQSLFPLWEPWLQPVLVLAGALTLGSCAVALGRLGKRK